jgi:hypothetical protein
LLLLRLIPGNSSQAALAVTRAVTWTSRKILAEPGNSTDIPYGATIRMTIGRRGDVMMSRGDVFGKQFFHDRFCRCATIKMRI